MTSPNLEAAVRRRPRGRTAPADAINVPSFACMVWYFVGGTTVRKLMRLYPHYSHPEPVPEGGVLLFAQELGPTFFATELEAEQAVTRTVEYMARVWPAMEHPREWYWIQTAADYEAELAEPKRTRSRVAPPAAAALLADAAAMPELPMPELPL